MADADVRQTPSISSTYSCTNMAQRESNGSNGSSSSSDVDITVEHSTPDVTELEIAERLPSANDADSNNTPNISGSTSNEPPIQVTLPTPTSQPTFIPQSAPVANTVPSTLQAASLPKARLPHDTTGILEDRIKDDPRGDLEAWLALINEHRKRNKLDDARAVYERFFKVFPQAVSLLNSFYSNPLT